MNHTSSGAGNQVSELEKVRLVADRIREFCNHKALWHRRLWNVGTVLCLREVVEYAESCIDGRSPNTEGLRYVIEAGRREVKRDPGVAHLAAQVERSFVELDKKSTKEVKPAPAQRLRELVRRAESEYCAAWSGTQRRPAVEFMSRAVAAHLLDSGLSADHLHRWLRRRAAEFKSVAELLQAVEEMSVEMPERRFDVFVPSSAPFRKPQTSASHVTWLDSSRAAEWLQNQIPYQERRRHNGGFVVSVTTRDPWSAVAAARATVARAASRARVARMHGQDVKVEGWACVAGSRQEFGMRPLYRPLEIGSLDRQDAVYRFDGAIAPEVDDALELASYMASPGSGAAITGGWSAVESLLLRPGESGRYRAADRMASLVACSLPRAEMTTLAYRHIESTEDDLARELDGVSTNFAKVQIVEKHLRSGRRLVLEHHADVAAQERILAIIRDPAAQLGKLRRFVAESLRRLYNQRNIVAHSGSFRSAALEATTRTAFSLVGAGLDRVVHEQLSRGETATPLQLVARAENELNLAGSAGGRPLSSLLE
ncbi:hypothetical protein [Candidatus Poriferisodalis sp.]|uniref:hypothetical protein n=1 Tax=Candidatus Poriferisodalis sp. TaxID=3101277 RepID=UPI003B026A60